MHLFTAILRHFHRPFPGQFHQHTAPSLRLRFLTAPLAGACLLAILAAPSLAQVHGIKVVGYSKDGQLAALRVVNFGYQETEAPDYSQVSMEIDLVSLAQGKSIEKLPVIDYRDMEGIVINGNPKWEENPFTHPKLKKLRSERWPKVNQVLQERDIHISTLPAPVQTNGKSGEAKAFLLNPPDVLVQFLAHPKKMNQEFDAGGADGAGTNGSFPAIDVVLVSRGKTIVLKKMYYPEEANILAMGGMFNRQRFFIEHLYLSPNRKHLIAIESLSYQIFDLGIVLAGN